MESLQDLDAMFKKLEQAKFYKDIPMVRRLSNEIYRRYNEYAEYLMNKKQSYIDAGGYYLKCSELMQTLSFFEAVKSLKKSIDCFTLAAEKAKAIGRFRDAADHYKKIAELCKERLMNFDRSERFYRETIRCLLKEANTLEEIGSKKVYDTYYSLAEIYSYLSDWREAEKYARKVIDSHAVHRKYYMIANAYKLLLELYLRTNRQEDVLVTFFEARQYFEMVLENLTSKAKAEHFENIANVYHIVAGFFDIMEDMESFQDFSIKEAECYLDAAHGYEIDQDLVSSALYYHSAGLILKKIGNYDVAFNSFLKSAEMYESLSSNDRSADNYIYAAYCLEVQEKFTDAISLILKAVDLYTDTGSLDIAIYCLYQALEIHELMVDGNATLRKTIINRLIELLEMNADRLESSEKAHQLLDIAFIAFNENDEKSCLNYLEKALDILHEINFINRKSDPATPHDILLVIILLLIFTDSSKLPFYVSCLEDIASSNPAGKNYLLVARELIDQYDENIETGSLNSRFTLGTKIIQNLIIIKNNLQLSRMRQ
ncbi:MAG: hypothetical protein ACTSWN_10265 [Promethearchaeota archaeon]